MYWVKEQNKLQDTFKNPLDYSQHLIDFKSKIELK